mmetsp:Transcript_7449/g.26547  ORF Transcript_7449/g.26547 Transcript_7449/m.26547 type:complete len:198 (-) Transcript_7449:475-1068(-)
MGRRKDVLEAACKMLREEGIHAAWIQGDVRSSEDGEAAVTRCLETFGKLDILVNCAAGNFLAPASKLSPKGFKTVMDIDAVGTFNMCRASFSALARSPTPVIINISATLHHGATWLQAHASAAKAAVDSLTRSLALEWGQYGIRVVGVAPGPVEATAGMTKLAPLPEKELEGEWKNDVRPQHSREICNNQLTHLVLL